MSQAWLKFSEIHTDSWTELKQIAPVIQSCHLKMQTRNWTVFTENQHVWYLTRWLHIKPHQRLRMLGVYWNLYVMRGVFTLSQRDFPAYYMYMTFHFYNKIQSFKMKMAVTCIPVWHVIHTSVCIFIKIPANRMIYII